ncbi:RAD52 family DNA repair protein [Pseudooceanicola sp. C21-150M6]|uniref:RAD52 family DNA repair protein n=1 Tax=Pseudooceanicola sp. C21-150M6 TaxID=3434355 RepID=UPI003D7F3BE3
MDWDKATAELSKKLDPSHVKSRSQGGGSVSYVEGWHAIAEANRIFGFGEWTRETLELRQLGDPREVGGKMRVEYMARVRVTVAGVVRDGCGFGQGIDKDVGQAHESALKEAETDAMKRALMTFGNPFGLALYDKSRENVGTPEKPFDPAETRDRIKNALSKARDLAELERIWKHPATEEAFGKLHPAMQGELTKAHTDRVAFLSQAPEGTH